MPLSSLRSPDRLAALQRLRLPGPEREAGWDRLTRLVTEILGVSASLVCLADADRLYFPGSTGLAEPWASRREAPLACTPFEHVVATGEPLVVADARAHPRLRDHPTVREMGIGACLAVPLETEDGHVLGALCAIDRGPREWSEREVRILASLAAGAMTEAELRARLRGRRPSAPDSGDTAGSLPELMDRVCRLFLPSVRGCGLLFVSPDGAVRNWSPAAEGIYGYTDDEVLARHFSFLAPPEDRHAGRPDAILADAALQGQHESEGWQLRKDGTRLWARMVVRALGDAGRAPLGFAILIHDLSEWHAEHVERLESEERHRRMVESVPLPTYVWRRGEGDFFLVGTNPAAVRKTRGDVLRLLGIAGSEFARENPDIVRAIEACYARRATLRRPLRYPRRVRAGEYWEVATFTYVAPDLVTVYTQDITPIKKAEKALRRSEEYFRALIEQAHDIITVLEVDGTIRYSSPSVERVLGWPAAEMEGRNAFHLVHPEDMAAAQEAVGRVLSEGGEPVALTYRVQRRDGEWATIESTASDLRGHPAVLGIVVNSRDVTDRHRSALQLRDSQRLLNAILEGVPIGIFVVDRDGRSTLANQAAVRILGRAPTGELSAAAAADAFQLYRSGTDALYPADENPIQRALNGEFASCDDMEIRRADGAIPLHVEAAPLHDADASVSAAVAAIMDVSGQRSMEAQLRQAARMEAVGQLAGGVAHDFNNLLTVIKGNTALVLADPGLDAETRGDLEQVRRAADRAADLARRLLAFSRQQVLRPQALRIGDTVVEIGRMLGRMLGEDIRLVTGIAPDTGPVLADPSQVEQVILNLAVNARDAMPGGGVLRIATCNASFAPERPGEYVCLEVSDTGVGMDAATQARMWEPFFTTKQPGKGTGLGLATVYGIVRQSGGHVEVRSAPGQGACFRVYLPRAGEEPDAAPAPPLAAPVVSGGTILLAEDAADVREYTRRVLARAGYTVLDAPSGEAALRVLAEAGRAVDLLVTDVIMPGLTGRELAERVLAQRPGMRVLYISGHTEDSVILRGVRSSEVNLLQKPYTPDELVSRVAEVLSDTGIRKDAVEGRGDEPLDD